MSLLRVKILPSTGGMRRQLPSDHILNGIQFVLDRESEEYDWLAVYSGFQPPRTRFLPASEPLSCRPENTLLITHEPASVRRYGNRFASQFHWVISCHKPEDLNHPRLIPGHPASPWFYPKTYGELLRAPVPEKTALFSTFCSEKGMTHTLHHDRLAFTKKLSASMPEMDVFGKIGGGKYLRNKADGLDPYKYHLAIENHVGRNHWSEKLADAFLGHCLPIYCGCPNIFDFFPENSLIPIDIFDYDGSVERIRRAIRDNEHEKRVDLVKEARKLVIEEHNLLAVISRFVREHHAPGSPPSVKPRIWNHSGIVRLNPVEGLVHAIKKNLQKHRYRRNYEALRRRSRLHSSPGN